MTHLMLTHEISSFNHGNLYCFFGDHFPCTSLSNIYFQQLAGNDASHDWHHIERVWKLSCTLADKEGITDPQRRETIELAALLHDINDWKYSGRFGLHLFR